jgi:hypothetical protein
MTGRGRNERDPASDAAKTNLFLKKLLINTSAGLRC